MDSDDLFEGLYVIFKHNEGIILYNVLDFILNSMYF